VIFFTGATGAPAQTLPNGRANAFTTDMYYEHPDEQQVKTRLSGAEATPLPGGLLDVKDLRVEEFSTNGVSRLVARAPQCTYAMLGNSASSTGHLVMQSGDGKFQTEGDGFLFVTRTNGMTLIISNNVHTVIESGFLRP
jgi:hypothetical protein